MPSKTMQTREEQKTRFLQQSETRKTALLEQGFDETHIKKDNQIKHLKARIKQINSAIARITFLEDQTKKLQEKKLQKLAEAAAERAESIKPGAIIKKKRAEEKLPEPSKKGSGGGKGKDKSKQDGKKQKS